MSVQLKNWAVCQICGLTVSRTQATPDDGWLVSPYRWDADLDIIRCPRHISEWALRESEAGRTKFWRQKMAEGKETEEPPIPPWLTPIPINDEPPPGV